MCFVLDINSFHRVFNPKSPGYQSFAPLRDWLYNSPRTSLVLGGRHYRLELSKLNKYLQELVELKRARKLSEVLDQVVDAEESRVASLINRRCFDDPHIVGLLSASGCIIFASHDKRADPFVKNRSLYPKGQRVRIFHDKCCKSMLCNANIVSLRNLK